MFGCLCESWAGFRRRVGKSWFRASFRLDVAHYQKHRRPGWDAPWWIHQSKLHSANKEKTNSKQTKAVHDKSSGKKVSLLPHNVHCALLIRKEIEWDKAAVALLTCRCPQWSLCVGLLWAEPLLCGLVSWRLTRDTL